MLAPSTGTMLRLQFEVKMMSHSRLKWRLELKTHGCMIGEQDPQTANAGHVLVKR